MLTTFPHCKFWLELPEILSQNHICYHCLSVSGLSNMMHCGILIKLPYRMFYHESKAPRIPPKSIMMEHPSSVAFLLSGRFCFPYTPSLELQVTLKDFGREKSHSWFHLIINQYYWSKIMSAASTFFIIIHTHNVKLIHKQCPNKDPKSLPLWQKNLGYHSFKSNTLHKYHNIDNHEYYFLSFYSPHFFVVELGRQWEYQLYW